MIHQPENPGIEAPSYFRKGGRDLRQLPVMKGARMKKALLWGGVVTSAVAGTSVLGLWAAGEFNITAATPVAVEQKQEEVSQEARSFTLQFAHEYFKWTVGQPERREERLKPFLAQGMDPQAGLDFSNLSRHAVPEHLTIWKEELKGKGEYVITVSALVNFYDAKDTKKYFTKRMLLEVPIKQKNERDMAVIENPRLVPLPAETSIQKEREELDGQMVDSAIEQEIRSAAESFFKTFTSGKREELSYLMVGDVELDTFQGKMQFKAVEQMQAVKKGDRVISDLVLRLADPNTGMEVSVSYQVDWVKEDGRWFVEAIR